MKPEIFIDVGFVSASCKDRMCNTSIGMHKSRVSLDTLLNCCNFDNQRDNKTQAAIVGVALMEKEKPTSFVIAALGPYHERHFGGHS